MSGKKGINIAGLPHFINSAINKKDVKGNSSDAVPPATVHMYQRAGTIFLCFFPKLLNSLLWEAYISILFIHL
jgi:hypothetical protein